MNTRNKSGVESDLVTYELFERDGRGVIRCRLCGSTSYHPKDIQNRYCGRCHLFHDTVMEARGALTAASTHDCGEWQTGLRRCALCQSPLLPKQGP